MKQTTFEISVRVVGTSGSPEEKTVKVPASATVGEVAAAAGIKSLKRLNLSVDGKPATEDTRVTSKSKVTITERPQGS